MQHSRPKQLRIAGTWADEIAGWGDLSWSTKWGGGLHEITWSMETDDRYRPHQLRGGVLVELYDGAARIGTGTMVEPDMASGSFTAEGLYRRGEHFLCLDGSGNGTSVANTAIDQAIIRGLEWFRPTSVSGAAFSEASTTMGANYLSTLLDGLAEQTSTRWYLDSEQNLRFTADPTIPLWLMLPGVADLGAAQDGYASDLYGRVNTSGGYVTRTASDTAARSMFGRHEHAEDLTALGVVTAAKADLILAGLLRDKARPAFSSSVEVTADQLLTLGGVPADLSMVQAGQMVRTHGFYDDVRALSGLTYLDWVIGETRYEDGADSIQLSPLNIAARDLRSVIASMGDKPKFQA